jgi:flagellar basal body-associated protein FliL
MNNEQKAELYDRFMAEYDRLDNQISQVKMNKFELSSEDQKITHELERKKSYIMDRIRELS